MTMQIRLLIAIFVVFACILVFILLRSYVSAINAYELPEIGPYEFIKSSKSQHVSAFNWLDRFLGQSKRDFVYPASELQVKLLYENEAKRGAREIFRISVGTIDDYQFFCINQVFEAHNIEYSYYKIGESIWLVVATEDKDYLHDVLEKLKHYAISYTISKT